MNLKGYLFFVPEHLREEIEGDLLQRFERDVRSKGRAHAKLRLFWNILRFFRPGILFRKNHVKQHIPVFMLKNYFVIAVRNMMAHKMNSTINMLSLIVGITSALIMISVIRYELSFDSYHTNSNRTYRIYRAHQADGDYGGNGVPGPLADAFRNEVTAIEKITGVQYYGGIQVDVEANGEVRKFKEPAGVAIVDSEFFNVFDFKGTGFKWISGNPLKALSDPFSVVITQSIARKYFADGDPLGKSMTLESQLPVKITGVITDLPPNSDFPFTILVSYPTLYEIEGDKMKDDWISVNADHQAFVTLPESVSVEEAEAQFYKVHSLHVDKKVAESRIYVLQPLSEVHRNPQLNNFNRRSVDETILWIMAVTGLLLLSVGCINYINIATAQSTLRGKEIGIRKALGSKRKQLVFQFISETFVLVFLACIVSVFLADIALMNLGTLTSMVLLKHLFTDPMILASLAILIVTVTTLAGFYPAVVVSGYSVIGALKGLTGSRVSSAYLRKTLVVVQFAVTQVFLIGAFIVINQLQYSRSMDLGFDKDLIVNIPLGSTEPRKVDDLKNMVLNNPTVSGISVASSYPSGDRRNHWFVGAARKGNEERLITEYQAVDTAYFDVYHIPFVAGRDFVNSDSINAAILNENLSSSLGFKAPEDAISNVIDIDGKEYVVVGVVRDFHNSSIRDKVGGMAFVFKPRMFLTTSVKLNDPTSVQESLVSLEKIWSTVFPYMVFEYRFFDENIDNFYREEKKLSTLLQIFSGVFLLLACLGLYGLMSFVINRRMKEVAVRKVFGAGVMNILQLISKDYVALILISFLIAAPLSYYFMNQWLEGFSFHIPITWWILATPGVIALAIAMMTLSGKLITAASRNPAETLKHE